MPITALGYAQPLKAMLFVPGQRGFNADNGTGLCATVPTCGHRFLDHVSMPITALGYAQRQAPVALVQNDVQFQCR